MSRKRVSATTIIGGSDGPTSIFLVGNKEGKLSLKQKFERACYKIRKKRAENSVKADAHTMDEVCEYIVNELGYTEVDKTEFRYKEEYRKIACICGYMPLGFYKNLTNRDNAGNKVN